MAATMTSSQALAGTKVFAARPAQPARRSAVVVRAGKYDEELIKTAKQLASPGRGLLAIDESNATAGKRLDSIGGANPSADVRSGPAQNAELIGGNDLTLCACCAAVENTPENRRAYRTLLLTAPGAQPNPIFPESTVSALHIAR